MKTLRILLVEDDVTIGDMLAEVLVGMGHVVCGPEATEAGAIQAAFEFQPDLMIVDERLRVGSGMAAVAAISRVAVIPHIFMSGERLPALAETAVVLQKPFAIRSLVNAIDRASGWVQAG